MNMVQIAAEKDLPIVLRLGGFHFVKSFLGCIGRIMEGSGLEDVFGLIYGENTVDYIMNGNAYYKALRAHFLVDAALYKLFSKTSNEFRNADVDKMKLLSKLEAISRTSKLWIVYHNLVRLLRQFLFAERTHDWELHLESALHMLPVFAAAGHGNYAKSGRLYVQLMKELKVKYPEIQKLFMRGKHTTRYSDEFFSGQFADETIEETLMRKSKTSGGLTSGRLRHDHAVSLWTATYAHLKQLENLMEEHLSLKRNKRQHKDLGKARLANDHKHFDTVYDRFVSHSPLQQTENSQVIRSLSTGLSTTDTKVNCECAVEVGKALQTTLDGGTHTTTLKTSMKVKPLSSLQKQVKVGEKKVYIEKTQLFNRLVILAYREGTVEPAFEHELTPVPAALFKMDEMMRPSSKSDFGTLIKKDVAVIDISDEDDVYYVVDGGWFIHQVSWNGCKVVEDVSGAHLRYFQRHFKDGSVVFDGYPDLPTTKDHEHLKRTNNKKIPVRIENMDGNTSINDDRECFLRNLKNKQDLVKHIGSKMVAANIGSIQAIQDADTDLVKEALRKSNLYPERKVIVVADDTDVLVMLCYHCTTPNLYIKSSGIIYNVLDISKAIANKDEMLFKYTWSGCDTVSGIFYSSKDSINKKTFLADIISTFHNKAATTEEIREKGERAMLITYGAGPNKKDIYKFNLSQLRYQKYSQQASRGKLNPDRLPPTKGATLQHALRVHQQLIVWKELDTQALDPAGRGWKEVDSKYFPVMTREEIAPANLLKFLCCNCKEGDKQCTTDRCCCKKSGMTCISACGECIGHCPNGNVDDVDDNDHNNEEEINSSE